MPFKYYNKTYPRKDLLIGNKKSADCGLYEISNSQKDHYLHSNCPTKIWDMQQKSHRKHCSP